jgi:hypothetical protein
MAAKKARKPRKYGPAASESVHQAMHEEKEGTLRSGRSGKRVTSREQAIAIGLSEARRKGAKVPRKAARSSSADKAPRPAKRGKSSSRKSKARG